jgi:hypothetical protein
MCVCVCVCVCVFGLVWFADLLLCYYCYCLVLRKSNFIPSQDHGRASVFELDLAIPISPTTATRLTISYTFEKLLLGWTEYPPDAHRGHDLPAAWYVQPTMYVSSLYVTQLLCSLSLSLSLCVCVCLYLLGSATIIINDLEDLKASTRPLRRVYSESALVSLPTPDFSMPYNVITMTCTVFSTFFGSMMRLLTRDHSPLREGEVIKDQRMVVRLIRRLLLLLGIGASTATAAAAATATATAGSSSTSTDQDATTAVNANN